MSQRTNPPFRADVVGSLLRPPVLLEAREKHKKGEITGKALRQLEDDAIRRGMDKLLEAGNPEWFIWQGDQGLIPIEEIKRTIRKVGEEVLPHYM